MNKQTKWRYTIPLNEMKINGICFKANYNQSIVQFKNIEELNKCLKTELEIKEIDFDEIHTHSTFHDWIENNFPCMYKLEYELGIWYHITDQVDYFDGDNFYIAEKFDGNELLICKYKNVDGIFAICGENKSKPERALKYFDNGGTCGEVF